MNELDRMNAQREDQPWTEYAAYPVQDWQHEVLNDNTRLGYWDWVEASIEWRMHDEQYDALNKEKAGPS